jgi:hypothetical protein
MLHVRICAGGAKQLASLPRPVNPTVVVPNIPTVSL